MIRISPIVLTVRYYEDSDTELGAYAPYIGVATVTIVDKIAHLSAIVGEIKLKDFKELKAYLKSLGVTELNWVHNTQSKIMLL